MKNSILFLVTLLSLGSHAGTKPKVELRELIVESTIDQEYSKYRLWSEDGKYFIEPYSNSDRGFEEKKSEVHPDQLKFILTKLDELKKLKNPPECDSRQISASFLIDQEAKEMKGCVDKSDEMSVKLNELSSILMILI